MENENEKQNEQQPEVPETISVTVSRVIERLIERQSGTEARITVSSRQGRPSQGPIWKSVMRNLSGSVR